MKKFILALAALSLAAPALAMTEKVQTGTQAVPRAELDPILADYDRVLGLTFRHTSTGNSGNITAAEISAMKNPFEEMKEAAQKTNYPAFLSAKARYTPARNAICSKLPAGC